MLIIDNIQCLIFKTVGLQLISRARIAPGEDEDHAEEIGGSKDFGNAFRDENGT